MFFTDYGQILESSFPCGEKNVNDFKVMGHSLLAASNIKWKWESDSELITLMLIKKLYPNILTLTIFYLPYGRADRNEKGGSSCSLRYVGDFIQSLGFEKITVLDPHSDLSIAYLGESACSYYPKSELLTGLGVNYTPKNSVVMFPDSGAQKRYGKAWYGYLHVLGSKTRDFRDGKLTGYSIADGVPAEGKHVIIVDDICSYGGTFILASNAIRKFNPLSVALVVTHCEDSIFNGDVLKAGSPIDLVVTTNSLITKEGSSKLKIVDVIKTGGN